MDKDKCCCCNIETGMEVLRKWTSLIWGFTILLMFAEVGFVLFDVGAFIFGGSEKVVGNNFIHNMGEMAIYGGSSLVWTAISFCVI